MKYGPSMAEFPAPFQGFTNYPYSRDEKSSLMWRRRSARCTNAAMRCCQISNKRLLARSRLGASPEGALVNESGSGKLGLVVIGRNEGERLARCLASVRTISRRIYVDSGSVDDSAAVARNEGFKVIELSR